MQKSLSKLETSRMSGQEKFVPYHLDKNEYSCFLYNQKCKSIKNLKLINEETNSDETEKIKSTYDNIIYK